VIDGSDLVFRSLQTDAPISGFDYAKRRIALPTSERWTLHDLRRTAATNMARLGIAPHVVEKILNHSAGTIKGVARIYNRYAYAPECAAALRQYSAWIERMCIKGGDNVVPLVARQS
jgi:hypothetical protein